MLKQIVERAKEAGYKELSELIKEGKTCKPGDKSICSQYGKGRHSVPGRQ